MANCAFPDCRVQRIKKYHMKLFWEQQREVIGKGTGVRYHPMIIRSCLLLAAKSASAYDELRSSKVLTLPTRRTLRDYKNAVKPGSGSNHQVIDELTKIASGLTGCQRYVVLSFDEMKIKENLVYDKYSGQFVGYVYLGDHETIYASFKDPDTLATHVLVFYIRDPDTLATHVLVFYIRGLATHVLVFYIRRLATHVLVFYIRRLATHVLVFYIRGLASDLKFECNCSST